MSICQPWKFDHLLAAHHRCGIRILSAAEEEPEMLSVVGHVPTLFEISVEQSTYHAVYQSFPVMWRETPSFRLSM